jgi:hypothetical protein
MRARIGLLLPILLVLVACAAAFTFACGGSTAVPGGSSTPAMQACSDEASATCAKLDMCVQNGTMIDYGSAATCEARVASLCLAALQANGTGRTPDSYEACAQSLPTQSCADNLDNNSTASCRAPAGSLATGAACGFPAQCMTAFCAIPPASACGTCQPPPAAGASCANLDTCGPGLQCVAAACVAYAALGQSCSATVPCGTGLSCVTPAMATTGKCETAGAMGAACDGRRETAPACDGTKDLYCDGTRHCAADAYAMAGQPCGNVNGVGTLCTGGAACVDKPADGGTVGSCAAPAADGQPCNTVAGPPCTRPARCIGMEIDGGQSGTCALAGATACQ